MKYLKHYTDPIVDDKHIKNIQIGDYAYCEVPEGDYKPNKFIGQLTRIFPDQRYSYRVSYIKADKEQDRLIKSNEIIDFAKTSKELEHYMDVMKYNI